MKISGCIVLIVIFTFAYTRIDCEESQTKLNYTNHLINETSPYLLQHAHNPVNWYPWGDDALTLARELNKPIFLSIGYSACHWCHVMEHESFQNEEVAAILNEHFVSIKVDREERPDIDNIYMNAVQMMTGSGGWPLSIWLTPLRKPFFGGTYFPPDDRWGRPGFKNMLLQIVDVWKNRNDELMKSADELTEQLMQLESPGTGTGEIGMHLWKPAFDTALRGFDERNGGFGKAPKFPQPMELSFLLRFYFHTGERSALSMVEKTLYEMARGGIYDHLGGGFHRYSTDDRWFVPHFEKMLYDNALLTVTYLEAFQLTQKPFYAEVTRSTLKYVLNEMTSPEGGFYSSQDADSEGEEGKYYVWDATDVEGILGEHAAQLFMDCYGISKGGNWEGVNILHQRRPNAVVAKEYSIDERELSKRMADARAKLLSRRSQRVPPATDDKILTSWNAMMISALCRAHQVLGDQTYLEAAQKAVDFLLQNLYIEKSLKRTWRAGKAQISGYLSDYALLIEALLDLYETSFEESHLRTAVELNGSMLTKFWDEDGGFYFTEMGQSDILLRTRNPYDNPVPSGNSAAVHSLARLSRFTGDHSLMDKASEAFRMYAGKIQNYPSGFSYLLSALDFLNHSAKEIVLSGPRDATTFKELKSAIQMKYLPNKVLAYADASIRDKEHILSPLVGGKFSPGDEVRVFVCENFSCKAPFTSIEEFDHFYHTMQFTNKETH